MKISELMEAIKGWKHAHSDIAKMRAAKAAHSHTAKLVSLKKDGTESRMHDAVSTYPTESEARARHADIVKMNPGRQIRHNLYVHNQLVGMLDTNLQEVSHKVGQAAGKALANTGTTDPVQQQKYMLEYQELQAKEKQIQSLPDANTGKYASQLMNISRQKIQVARAGGLNAWGQPLVENASSGATSSGSIATVAQAGLPIQRRPSLFGYVPAKPSTKNKKKRGANK